MYEYKYLVAAALACALICAAPLAEAQDQVQDPSVPSPMQPTQQRYDVPQAQPVQQPVVVMQPAPMPAGTGTRLVRERYHEGMPVPPGARVYGRRKTGLIISGAVTFAVTYLLTGPMVVAIDRDLGSAGVGTRSTDYLPVVPVLGPLLSHFDDGSYRNLPGLAIMSMLAQSAGILMFSLGMMRRQYIEYYMTTDRGRTLAFTPTVVGGPQSAQIGGILRF